MSAHLCAAGLLLVGTLACQSESKHKAKEASAPTVTNEVEKASAPTPAAETKTPAPVSLPKFSGEAVSDDAAKKSRELNIEALTLHRAKDFEASAPLFIKSLLANPGNILARYNLACTYNLAGNRQGAIEALSQLREANCRACLAQVKGAPTDKDFASALTDPKFVEVTSGIEVKSATKMELAELVMLAFDKNDVSLLADYVHPSRATKFSSGESLCDSSERSCSRSRKVYGLDEFTKAMKREIRVGEDEDSMVSFTTGTGVGSCDANCCYYDSEGGVGHGMYWLTSVCYVDRAGTLFLSELGFTDES